MGGDTNQQVSNVFAARSQKAAEATDCQIQEAIALHKKHFLGDSNPHLLPAIIQAVAANYAARTLAASNNK